MKRRNFVALLAGTILAAFLPKKAEVTPPGPEGPTGFPGDPGPHTHSIVDPGHSHACYGTDPRHPHSHYHYESDIRVWTQKGWVPCDGRIISRQSYASLFAAIAAESRG